MSNVKTSGFLGSKLTDDGKTLLMSPEAEFDKFSQDMSFEYLKDDTYVRGYNELYTVALKKLLGYKDELREGKRVDVHLTWTLADDGVSVEEVTVDRVDVVG